MAAILQLRRGSGSVSLMDGELYLHKSSGSLQVSLGDGNPITLARLDQINSGSLKLSGDVTASNAYFTNNVRIDGNIILGDGAAGDTIQSLGVFTTNLIPQGSRNIGATDAYWSNVYATSFSGSFSGSINGINEGITTFSASVDGRLDRLQESTASLNAFSSSEEAKNIIIGAYTSSMNAFTSSQLSKDVIISSYTSSMNTFTSSTNNRLSNIESYTSSLRTAIDVSGGNTRILGNLIVDGTQTSLNTTETYIEDKSITLASGSTTSAIADGAGLNIAGAGVSMSWDHTNTRLYFNTNISALGSISSSTIVGLNGVSVTSYSTSVDSRLSNLQTTSASVNGHITDINAWTASNGNTSLNQYTASATIRLNNLESTSASVNGHITDINTKTGSFETKFNTIQSVTSSLNAFTASQESKDTTLQIVTSSLNLATASFNNWTGSTFNTFSTSVDTRLDDVEYMVTVLDPGNIGDTILGLNAFTASSNNRLNNLEATSASINAWSSSLNTTFATDAEVAAGYEIKASATHTLVSSSAQITDVLTSVNSYTASLKNAITISGTDVSVAGNLTVLGTTTVIDTTTLAIKDNIVELNAGGGVNGGLVVRDVTGTTTSGSLLWDVTNDYWIAGPLGAESKLLRAGGDNVITSSTQITPLLPNGTVSGSSQVVDILSSLNSFTSSLDATYATEAEVAAGYEAKGRGIVSGSSQVSYLGLSNIPAGIISSSAQIDSLFNIDGIVSGSSQIDLTATTNYASGILTRLNVVGVVSGSSQITAGSTTNWSTDVKTQLNANTVVSGSSQITLSATTGGGTGANVQFGSLGIGTTASGVSGEIRATGDIVAYYSSDERLKENITPIENAVDKINQIGGYNYDWKEGFETIHSHKGHDLGVIAQEVQSVLPEVVTERETGYLAVDYVKLVPVLIEAIKELSAKIDRLENK